MYRMTCDGHPLLDVRDESLILTSPKIKLEVNTVGEGSFKIYNDHPHYNFMRMLKSIFEVSDERGAIFRGRMTENTKDIHKGRLVDLEGVMAFFNDSVVRPYTFPDDFLENPEYQAAAAETPEQAAIDGGVVRFLLKWYIDRHNEQVENGDGTTFQQFKLGNVTVYDKNNFIERASSDYPSTWEEISDKLFNSSLGGYLCIRYELDGNYIDYLREFTEINEQGIEYGKNLRDFSQKADGNETYTAIIPLGAELEAEDDSPTKRLTIDTEDLPNGSVMTDIVKRGDILYSNSAVKTYGWRFAPRADTTWDDITVAANLQTRGIEYLVGNITKVPNTIEVKAVDLHCVDANIRSLRIYKKIPIYVEPYGINETFDLTSLDIDLLNPQNTNITAGKKKITLTSIQKEQQKAWEKKQEAIDALKNKVNVLDSGLTTVSNANATTNQDLATANQNIGTTNLNLAETNRRLVTAESDVAKAVIKADELVVDANNKKAAIEQNWTDISNIKGKLDEVIAVVNGMGGSIQGPPPINTKPSIDVMEQIK